ncbi:spore coat protein [Caproiciproducens sp. NJN-50]|uniref:spore coat protein n=1 Tax=Acutalibacteraceae TaxID=3082771 RepID=UPI000FFE0241|nr:MULTISPECIES: spore coat protein [Acutalibacteraceae]QAT50005.1 spore coat protein [Caproiciproducens sp. NJN-50]
MISEKELSAIEDQLAHERVLITKYNAYSQMCNDQELKQKCSSIAQKHQCHYDTLMGFLNC